MGFLIGLLTVVMVLDCLALIFLVLIQLPKKDAGAGLAFGGQATDALFGAGSGNVLTKATKYAAVGFFILAMVLSILQSHQYSRTHSEFRKELEQQSRQAPASPKTSAPAPARSTRPCSAPASTPPRPPLPARRRARPHPLHPK